LVTGAAPQFVPASTLSTESTSVSALPSPLRSNTDGSICGP
jgi:hypothetical protein